MTIASLLLIGACAQTPAGPPEIDYGIDVCEECGMSIEDPRFAASYRDATGTEHLFDEIGEMLVLANMLSHLEQGEFWVHDYTTQEPIPAADAYYLYGPDIVTPMNFRIVAFATEAEALAFAEINGGLPHRWHELVEMAKADQIVPNPGTGDPTSHQHGG